MNQHQQDNIAVCWLLALMVVAASLGGYALRSGTPRIASRDDSERIIWRLDVEAHR